MKSKKQTKVITYNSDDDDNTPICKETYDEILEERMDEILKMSRKLFIVIQFMILKVQPYIQLKNCEKILKQVEKEQKQF